MSTKGNTVVGDALYGRTPSRLLRALNDVQKQVFNGFKRHALHAYILGFLHPRTGEEMYFENELPSEINELCEFLKKV
jgi:23S rRNA pseudouridine1911/1915/1917 synthase